MYLKLSDFLFNFEVLLYLGLIRYIVFCVVSGIFTAFSEHSTPSNLHKQSISESLRRRRPLISPASFVPELSAPFKSSKF